MNRDKNLAAFEAVITQLTARRARAFRALAKENERRAAEGKPPLRLRQTKPKP